MIIEGTIVRHDEKPFLGQILIGTDGLIEKVLPISEGKIGEADVVYGDDSLIFPGMGDVHIHAREDQTGEQCYKEDYTSSGDAALNGGVVHASAMPNTPKPLTTEDDFNWHRERIAEIDHCVSLFNYVGIDKNTSPLGPPGSHFYKCFFGKSVGDLTVMFASELEEILKRYEGQYISFHVEYEPVVLAAASGRTHSDRRPVAAVNEGLRLLLPLVEKYNIVTKLCHWSTGGESFELIKEYQNRGCDIVLEVSPLHLLFDTSMTDEDPSLWTKIQMNPAIQSAEHRADLIEGLKNGFIDFLATDHAPHTLEEKHSAFARFSDEYPGLSNEEISHKVKAEDPKLYDAVCEENGMSGAPWLDTYGLVAIHLMAEHGFTPERIAHVTGYAPGQFVNPHLGSQFKSKNFGKGFGEIAEGFVGSLTVLNTAKETTLAREDLKTKCGWSPLEDRTFPGSVEAVYAFGKKVG